MATKKDWQGRINDWMQERFSPAPSLIEALAFPETSAYRPDLRDLRPAPGSYDTTQFGPRYDLRDGPKGLGWVGMLQSNHGVMTEYGIGGAHSDREQPSVVPTLTHDELKYLTTAPDLHREPGPTVNNALTSSILKKSDDWAAQRRAQGLSPFYD